MSETQLWRQARINKLEDMVGNAEALAELRATPNGFILISGPMGCGKTSLALALAKERTGYTLEENQTVYQMGRVYAAHRHAVDFDLGSATERQVFFYWPVQTFIVVDEAQCLTSIRQQTKLKTLPPRPELTLIFCTTDPQKLDPALVDRCTKIHLGPLAAREIPQLVKRACEMRGIPYDVQIVQALNRGQIFRPRAIFNVVDAVARGKSIVQACAGQAVN